MKNYLTNVIKALPARYRDEVIAFDKLYELHLRPNKRPVAVCSGGTSVCSTSITAAEFEGVFLALSGGNRYKHEHTLTEGYFTDVYGGRCGVGCEVRREEAGVRLVRIHSLNIRVPRFIPDAADEVYAYMKESSVNGGVLIIGAPASGKTTLIRALAGKLATPPERETVCVVDERGEFCADDYSADANIDILIGYRKKQGAEIAVRTMGAHTVVCDEIGEREDDIPGVFGARLIATAHAQSLQDVLNKANVNALIERGLFSLVVKAEQICGKRSYAYYRV